MELYERFRATVEHLRGKQSKVDFAKYIGANRTTIAKYFTDDVDDKKPTPNVKIVSKIAIKFPDKIDWKWLLTGEGSMLPNGINVTNSGSMGDVVGASKYTVMADDLDFLRKELENKNKMIERLQKTNEQLSEKVTKLLEDKINYLQQK